MARKSKVLWGHTKYKGLEVPIYKVTGVAELSMDAWLETWPPRGKLQEAEICIQSFIFQSPKLFDETLIHEFIHVIERAVGVRNLGHRFNGTTCTKSAQVLGEGLSQMLRALRQADLCENTHLKPRKHKPHKLPKGSSK